jgi:hypothetical protein
VLTTPSASPIGDWVLNQAVSIGREASMKKQALTTTEIETSAPRTSVVLHESRQTISEDSGFNLSQPNTRRRAKLHWFIETLALAGGAMAGLYVDAWLDAPDLEANSEDTESKE